MAFLVEGRQINYLFRVSGHWKARGQSATPDSKKLPKIGKKEGKSGEKEEKSQNREEKAKIGKVLSLCPS